MGDLEVAVDRAGSAGASIAPPGVPAATAYGEHLRLVVACALAARPGLFSDTERALADALANVPVSALDALGRLCARVRQAMPMSAGAALACDAPGGWTMISASEIALTSAASALVRAALAVAFADPGAELSFFPRLALGRHPLPSGSPCARVLAAWTRDGLAGAVAASAWPSAPDGAWVPPAFASRVALDAWLDACAARADGPSPALANAALAVVEACAGDAWQLLGGQLDARHGWIGALGDCLAEGVVAEDARARAWRALRRAPCPPRLARRLWEVVHRRAHARAGRALAAHLASMSIWSPAERARWQSRAKPPRAARARAVAWPIGRISAWLEHDGVGAVVAQGERVEAHAARRLTLQGWQVAHAEGGFWSALAEHLLWDALIGAAPATWVAPLQLLPSDWQRWGFAARRASALDEALAAVARDPLDALRRADARAAARPWERWSAPPPSAAAAAVIERMPRPALVGLLRAVTADQRAAAGLPDLIAWRGRELALWEVKSPQDQLSDAQRHWLGWLTRAGVAAGELRVDARPSEQTSWLAAAAPAAAAGPPRSATRTPRAARADDREGALMALCGIADDGSRWRAALQPGALLGNSASGWRLASELVLDVARWRGHLGPDAVIGWGRPITAVAGLAVGAVLIESRRGRRVVARRWHAVPAPWLVPLLIAEEADPAGGVGPRATLLITGSGWLVPRALCALEPVVATRAELAAVGTGSARDWRALPTDEPPRPEAAARALGLDAALASQLDLLGAREHLVAIDRARGGLVIAVAAPEEVLWLAADARLGLEPLAVPSG